MRRLALLALLVATSASSASLGGHVVSWDGKPIAGALVEVVAIAPGAEPSAQPGRELASRTLASASTQEDGAFAIESREIPAGLHALRVTPAGGMPLVWRGQRVAFGGTLPATLRIELPPLVTLDGVVLDERGAPAAGARVGVVAEGFGLLAQLSATTNERGAFRVPGLPADARARAIARLRDESQGSLEVRLPLEGASLQGIHLERLVERSGQLVAAGDPPRPLAALRLIAVITGRREPPAVIGEAVTDASGRYALKLPADAMLVPWQAGLRAARLVGGRERVMSAAPLQGIVTSSGKPVQGARVLPGIDGPAVTTDATGSFALPASDLRSLRVMAPWGEIADVRVERSGSVRVALAASRTMAGQVLLPVATAADVARPAAHALVRVELDDAPTVLTSTDAGGRFAVTVPGRVEHVVVIHEGMFAVAIPRDATSELMLSLAPAPTLAGRVTSAGKDVASALVLASAHDAPSLRSLGATDAAGRFALRMVPGTQDLRVLASGYLPSSTEKPAGPGAAVTLEPAGWIHVHCHDVQGRPVGGAIASPRPSFARMGQRLGRGVGREAADAPAELPSAVSAPDGLAFLGGLGLAECVELQVSRPGFARVTTACVTPTPDGTRVDAKLLAGATLRGVVRDAAGTALAGATVRAQPDPTTSPADIASMTRRMIGMATAVTDALGAYDLTGLEPGRVEIIAEAPGFVRSDPVPVDLEAGQIAALDLVLEAGAVLEGVVISGKGEPLEGAGIAVMPPGQGNPRQAGGSISVRRRGGAPPHAWSGADGSFRLEGLDPDAEVELRASLGEDESEPRVVKPGGDVVRLILAVKGRIEGQVLGDGGTAEVVVECAGAPEGRGRAPAEDGAFLVAGLPAGTYSCAATAGTDGEGRVDGLVVKDGETTTATIRLGPRPLLEVVVRDDATGEPIPNAGVNPMGGGGEFRTDAAGRARVAIPPLESTARLRVVADGFEQARAEVPQPRPATFEVRLSRAVTLRGRVVDAQGRPAAGARVGFSERLGGGGAETGADGSFSLDMRARSGRATISATRERDGVIERGSLEIDPAEALDGIVVNLEPVAKASILVEVQDGDAPALRASVAVIHASSPFSGDAMPAVQTAIGVDGRMAMGITDEQGTFAAEGLLPGEFAILAGRQGEATMRRVASATLAAGEQGTALVRLLGGWTISGRVVRSGAPAEGASVSASASAGTGFGAQLAATAAGAGGAFSLGPLPDAISAVVVEAAEPGGFRPLARAIAHPDGPPLTLDITGAALTGRIMSAGQPLAGVEVRAVSEERGGRVEVRTGPDGRFTLAELRSSTTYHVQASREGLAPAGMSATTPASGTLDVGTLELAAEELRGTARAESGARIPWFTLTLVRADGSWLPTLRIDVAPDGAWHEPGPAAEPLRYRAAVDGFGALVGTAAPGAPLDLVFPPAAALELAVLAPDGRPAVGATVNLVSWNGSEPDGQLVPRFLPSSNRMARTDDSGRVLLAPLTAGAYVLDVARDDLGRTRIAVTLAPGDHRTLTATLE